MPPLPGTPTSLSRREQRRRFRAHIGNVPRSYFPSTHYFKGSQFIKKPSSELKAIDNTGFNLNFKPAGNFKIINAMVLGTDLFHRVGRKVYMKSVKITGMLLPLITSTSADYGRIVIFFDRQPNGAAPIIGDVFLDSNAAPGTGAYSQVNLNNRERFKIVKDYLVSLPAQTTVAGAGVTSFMGMQDNIYHSQVIDWFLPIKQTSIYNATGGGTIADITSGALWMVCYCNNNTNEWTFSGNTRLRYYD